eukprot:TRINITY_DN80115_c0_g1_i1.p1 TRINITY_DN80115_c0_g1~~TRINITY_DN80115_c0_g1_i1.p1  ORF type:complete len:684 (+),score=109.44 TRINITY_DN80115_c0_g1_i1:80-2131(+)
MSYSTTTELFDRQSDGAIVAETLAALGLTGERHLLYGYAIGVVLLALYFIWESGPFHRSPRVEALYLEGLLVYMFVTSTMTQIRRRDEGPDIIPIFQLIHIVLLLLSVSIAQRVACPPFPPLFFTGDGARTKAVEMLPAPGPRAKGLAWRLGIDIRVMAEVAAGSLDFWFGDAVLVFVLVGVTLSMNMVFACQSSNTVKYVILYALDGLELSVLLYWLIHMGHKWHRLGALAKDILDKLGQAIEAGEAEELEYVLVKVPVAAMMLFLKKDFIELICERALEQGLLSTLSKASLIDALQKGGVIRTEYKQNLICKFFLSCDGEDLLLLKHLMDGSGNYQNLHKLIYVDLARNAAVQASILQHLSSCAKAARHAKGGKGIGQKIVSDIDDTLYSSGGEWPAGCDKQYPKSALYPGNLSLFRHLDTSFDGSYPSCNQAFLSARPHVYKDILEDHSYQLFHRLYDDDRLHSFPTLLPGSFRRSLLATVRSLCCGPEAWRQVGDWKYRTFMEFASLWLEYDFIFCGDDGQGDLLAAGLILENSESSALCESSDERSSDEFEVSLPACCASHIVERPVVLAALIHNVLPCGAKPLKSSYLDETSRLIQFRTYVGAAVRLHQLVPDIVRAAAVQSVTEKALENMEELLVGRNWEEEQRRSVIADLCVDVQVAQTVLKQKQPMALPAWLQA